MSVDDQIAIRNIVKKSGTSFYWGMNVLNNEKKRAMFSIYAFCRIVDDIADEIKNREEKKKKLKGWKNQIKNLYTNKKPNSSLEKELKYSIKKFKLELIDFYSIIDGMLMDAEKDIRFPAKSKLDLYCDRVAVAVGNLSIKVFGLSKREKKYALYLGRAFQLTNIARDFFEDYKNGRCYISSNYFKKNGVNQNMKTIIYDPKLQNVFQDMLSEAKDYYEKAHMESKRICKKKIIASEIMKKFYLGIHSKMFKRQIKFEKKVKLTFLEKFATLILFFIRY